MIPVLGPLKGGYGALRTASRLEFERPTPQEPNMGGKVGWEDPMPCSAEKGHKDMLLAPSSPTLESKIGGTEQGKRPVTLGSRQKAGEGK